MPFCCYCNNEVSEHDLTSREFEELDKYGLFSCMDCVEKDNYLVIEDIKQCCSCETAFIELDKNRSCPYCKSGNWVYGYIDEKLKRKIINLLKAIDDNTQEQQIYLNETEEFYKIIPLQYIAREIDELKKECGL